jgi:hypothetical protein
VGTVTYWFWRYTKGIRIVGLGPIRGNDGRTPRQWKKDAEEYYRTCGNPEIAGMHRDEWTRRFEAKIKPQPRPTREVREAIARALGVAQ